MALVAYTDENEETTSQPNAEQSPSQEVQTQTTSFSIVAYSIDEEEIRDQNSTSSPQQFSRQTKDITIAVSKSESTISTTTTSSSPLEDNNVSLSIINKVSSHSIEHHNHNETHDYHPPPPPPPSPHLQQHQHQQQNVPQLSPLNTSSLSTALFSSPSSKVEDFARWGPPPPSYPPDAALFAKVVKFHEHKRAGKSINRNLRRSKEFKNPDILTKLVELVGISEIGTNYPPSLWDPFAYQPTDYFKELDKAQQAFLAQKLNPSEKQKRTHIEFVSSSKLTFAPQLQGSSLIPTTTTTTTTTTTLTQPPSIPTSSEGTTTTKTQTQSFGTTGEKKRKSKWDQCSIDIQTSRKEEDRETKRPKHS